MHFAILLVLGSSDEDAEEEAAFADNDSELDLELFRLGPGGILI
jgi:hypothetical protein